MKKTSDDAAEWDKVKDMVSLDFGRYGGHYLCLFDCSKEGHIIINDSDADDYNNDDRDL